MTPEDPGPGFDKGVFVIFAPFIFLLGIPLIRLIAIFLTSL